MPRPQKYTDSEIVAAAQALIAQGEEINPMRVRMRLGGGNVKRIKAVLAGMPRRQSQGPALAGRLPPALKRELLNLTAGASQQILLILAKYWAGVPAASTNTMGEENAGLRSRITALEKDRLALSEKLALAESQREETERAMKQVATERDDLARNFGNLQSALRNAEADFRAAQRTIEGFERHRREDRDQIRDLHGRIEDLVGSIASLKTQQAVGPQEKGRSREMGSSKSRTS
ncbi:DNA-binding protein [Bradyrhizobium sp. USDA 3364]